MPTSEPKLPDRYDIERAAERSPLPTVARDVLYAFARTMQQGSTLILPQHMPSLSILARKAGWSKRHVQRALNYMEKLGILSRRRPSKEDARKNHARTMYTVHFEPLAGLGTGSPKEARDAQSIGLGPVRRKPRDRQSAELGTGSPGARDTMAHVSDLTDQQPVTDPELAFIAEHLAGRTGQPVSRQQAAEIRAVILARPGAQGQRPIAYIRRVITLDKHPERWLQPADREDS